MTDRFTFHHGILGVSFSEPLQLLVKEYDGIANDHLCVDADGNEFRLDLFVDGLINADYQHTEDDHSVIGKTICIDGIQSIRGIARNARIEE